MARGGLKRLVSALEREVAPSVFAAAALIEDEAKGLIMEGSQSGLSHKPSLPGSPPNNDLGGLVGNIEITQPEPLRALVSSNARYAAALEFGTSKMHERPYMRPAAERMRREVVATIAKGVIRAVGKLGS